MTEGDHDIAPEHPFVRNQVDRPSVAKSREINAWHPSSSRMRVQAAWASVSGVAYGLGYHHLPIGNWPIALVALAPLVIVLRGAGIRRAVMLGSVSGISALAVGFSWLPGALGAFVGVSTAAAYVAIVPFWLWHGGRFALFAFCTACATRNGWQPWLAMVAAFVTSESLYPMAVPWYLAGAVHDAPILLQIGDLGGPVLVGVVVLCVNLLAAQAAIHSRGANAGLLSRMGCLVSGGIVVAALAYGSLCLVKLYPAASRAPETPAMAGSAHAPRLTLGIIQGNTHPAEKEHDPTSALRRLLLLTKRFVAAHRVDVVIWSETSTGYSVDEGLFDRWLAEVVAPHVSVPMVLGTGIIGDGGLRTYNAAVSTSAVGRVVARYDKRRLFPIGEYVPLGYLFPGLIGPSTFAEGSSRGTFAVLGHSVAMTICYEGLWPGLVRDAVRSHDAQLLVNLTNDIRFGDTAEPWAHFALTKLRAVEQRRYLVRAANSGISAVVDPAGRVTAATELFNTQAMTADVLLMSDRTLYARVGDLPWYAISVACLLMTFLGRPVRLKRTEDGDHAR